MNTKTLTVGSCGRWFLARAALKAVCACQYYDLAAYLDCPVCGMKGDN